MDQTKRDTHLLFLNDMETVVDVYYAQVVRLRSHTLPNKEMRNGAAGSGS